MPTAKVEHRAVGDVAGDAEQVQNDELRGSESARLCLGGVPLPTSRHQVVQVKDVREAGPLERCRVCDEETVEACVVSAASSGRGRGSSKLNVFAVLDDLCRRNSFCPAFLRCAEPLFANTLRSDSVRYFTMASPQLRTNVGLVPPRPVGYKFANRRELNVELNCWEAVDRSDRRKCRQTVHASRTESCAPELNGHFGRATTTGLIARRWLQSGATLTTFWYTRVGVMKVIYRRYRPLNVGRDLAGCNVGLEEGRCFT